MEHGAWTDERLDDRFDQIDRRFDRLEQLLDRGFAELRGTMIRSYLTTIAGLLGVIAAILARGA
jgi:hypothetical protein